MSWNASFSNYFDTPFIQGFINIIPETYSVSVTPARLEVTTHYLSNPNYKMFKLTVIINNSSQIMRKWSGIQFDYILNVF